MTGKLMMTALLLAGLAVGGVALWPHADSFAQTSSKTKGKTTSRKTSGASVKVLDVRAEKAIDAFVREAAEVAREYEDSGHLDKAKQMYESILNFNPATPGLKEKIKELDEQLLQSNEVEIEIDTSRSWSGSQVLVFKGKPIRIQASGTYKFNATADLDAEGYPDKDPVKDELAPDVTVGALMGLMATKEKPGKPFEIGLQRDFTPNEDGTLFLKVNVPPGSKCSGKLQVRISGYVRHVQ